MLRRALAPRIEYWPCRSKIRSSTGGRCGDARGIASVSAGSIPDSARYVRTSTGRRVGSTTRLASTVAGFDNTDAGIATGGGSGRP